MKTEMRQKLARLPFEEKIRKVGELIELSRKVKTQRIREDGNASPVADSPRRARTYPQSAIRNPK